MLEFNNYYGFLYASCLTQKRLKMTFLYNYFKASQYCKPKPVGTKKHHFKKKAVETFTARNLVKLSYLFHLKDKII